MCSDFKGGVLCLDAGCSAPWLNCSHLAARGLCHARWRHLSPFARTRAFVWQRCLSSCGYCNDDACAASDLGLPLDLDYRDDGLVHIEAGAAADASDAFEMVWTRLSPDAAADASRRVYAPLPERKVAILRGARWLPPVAAYGCEDGREAATGASQGQRVAGTSCAFSAATTEAMVASFVAEHLDTLVDVFGVDAANANCTAIRPAYSTRSTPASAASRVHFDICDPNATAAARGFDTAHAWLPISVLAYPHHRWDASWEGATEFVRGACHPRRLEYPEADDAPPILAIAPLPHRTVVFSSDLLHRLTPPSEDIDVAVDGRPGNRFLDGAAHAVPRAAAAASTGRAVGRAAHRDGVAVSDPLCDRISRPPRLEHRRAVPVPRERRERAAAASNRYDVYKFHERPTIPVEATRERLWVFATGFDADWNTTVDERDAIESHLGWPVRLTQQPAELRRRGWEHFATKYADAFRLTMPQRDALGEYTRHWEVLRRCCGTQMSSSWRAALQGAAADRHACAAHDLDAVEAALMTTEVYRRFGARDKHLRSLSLRDGDLNGSYCRWANEQVGRRALAFNADLSIEF